MKKVIIGCNFIIGAFSALFLIICPATTCQSVEVTFPLSLQDAVSISLANNLGLKLNMESINSAEGDVIKEKGRFDTTLEAGARFRRDNQVSARTGTKERADDAEAFAGVSKQLKTGTALSLYWENYYDKEPDSDNALTPGYSSQVVQEMSQPLLKGLGSISQTAPTRAAEKSWQATIHENESFS